jgi:hypothetical protein
MADEALKQPITVFYSYSHRDERLRKRLEDHLSGLQRRGHIQGWHDRNIDAGSEWKTQIDSRLQSAQVILLLISPAFIASNYCSTLEMTAAMERHKRGEARVIPIILRPCIWQEEPFAELQVLPRDGKPVTEWSSPDVGFMSVAEGILRVVKHMRGEAG